MPETELGGEPVSYDVRNSDRARYPRIDINLSGVTVVIPAYMELDPETFLREKKDWVLEQEAAMAPYRDELPERRFADGATIPFQGTPHVIRVMNIPDHRVQGDAILLSADRVNRSSVQDELESLYRETAREKIHRIIKSYEPRIAAEPNQVYIKNQKTRWGSCSSKNNLNFNWRLLLAPPRILEYVVIHELVHLEHPNHSQQFWDRLSELCSHADQSREWLEENGHTLIFTEDDLS